MTQDELLSALAPIRMPIHFAEFTWRDSLLSLALGLILGLLISLLISRFTTRRLTKTDEVQLEIEQLKLLPPDARLVGLSHLLARLDHDKLAELGLQEALYDPLINVDPAPVERVILEAANVKA